MSSHTRRCRGGGLRPRGAEGGPVQGGEQGSVAGPTRRPPRGLGPRLLRCVSSCQSSGSWLCPDGGSVLRAQPHPQGALLGGSDEVIRAQGSARCHLPQS